MANAISQNNSRQLWDEIKKVRNINPTYSNCVDAAIGTDNIISLFANKYNALYNYVCFEYNEMSNMRKDTRDDIDKYYIKQEDDEIFAHTHNISIDDVRLAIKKKCISDCIDGIFSDTFINGTELLFSYISMLFRMMLTHGVAPQDVLLSTLVPIPKNKRGNKCDFTNYRQIAISSLLGKYSTLLFWISSKWVWKLIFLNLVLRKSSTVIYTSMLKETIDYYNEIKLIAIYYYWMPRRPLTELNITNYLIDCVTGICVQLYYEY